MMEGTRNDAMPWAMGQAQHILRGPDFRYSEALRRKTGYWIQKWIESANHFTRKGNHLEARIHWGVVGILMKWAKNMAR